MVLKQCDSCEKCFPSKDIDEGGRCWTCERGRYEMCTFAGNISDVATLRDYLIFMHGIDAEIRPSAVWSAVCDFRDELLDAKVRTTAAEVLQDLLEHPNARVSFAERLQMDLDVRDF